MNWRHALPLLFLVALVILLGVGLTLNPSQLPSPLIGKPVPAFELPVLDSPEKTFSEAGLRGQVSVVNVWASWCAACRTEHPVLFTLRRRANVPLIGLNYKDQEADARQWLARLGDPYTLSVSDLDGQVGIDWGVYGVPETFVIDADGVIRHKHIGELSETALEKEILPLIAELQAEAARR